MGTDKGVGDHKMDHKKESSTEDMLEQFSDSGNENEEGINEEATGEKPPRKKRKVKTSFEYVLHAALQNELKDITVKLTSFTAKNSNIEAKIKTSDEFIKNLTNHITDINHQNESLFEENNQMKLLLKELKAAFKELQTTNGTLKQTLEGKTKIISDSNIETENKNERIRAGNK